MNLKQKRLTIVFKEHVEAHIKTYVILVGACLLGGIVAVFYTMHMPPLSTKELSLYVDDFFKTIQENGTDAAALLKAGLLLQAENFVLLLLFSCMSIGTPLIAGFSFVSGFRHAFSIVLFFRLYGIRAIVFVLFGCLAHYLILVPCYLVLCARAIEFTKTERRENGNFKKKCLGHMLFFCLMFLIASFALLLQAYIEPLAIRLVAGLFLAT